MKSFSNQLLFSIALCAIGSNIVASQELALVDSRDRALPLSSEILQLCDKAILDASMKLSDIKDQQDKTQLTLSLIHKKIESAEINGLLELLSTVIFLSKERLKNTNSILDMLQNKEIELVKIQKQLSEDDPVRKAPLLSEEILGIKKLQKSIDSTLESLQNTEKEWIQQVGQSNSFIPFHT